MSEEFRHRKGLAYQEDATLLYLIYRRVARAQQDRLDVFEAIYRAKPVVKFEAGHIRQAIIKNEEMRRQGSDRLDRVASIQMMDSAMAGLLVNNLDQEIAYIRIIFDDEYQLMRREVHILMIPFQPARL